MPTIHDVPVNDLIERVAKELANSGAVKAPPFATYAKTGAHKERPPIRPDWWQIRAAAVLRKISVHGPIGVSKLRTLYGGKRNMGMAPERVYKGSGSVIRKILQQLDKAGLTKHTKIGLHLGRIITPKGKSLLDKTATTLAKDLGISIRPAPASPHPDSPSSSQENQDPSRMGDNPQETPSPAQTPPLPAEKHQPKKKNPKKE